MKLNENKKIVDAIKRGLEKTGGYCPCLVLRNEDTLCPCKDVRESFECRCGLFVREDNYCGVEQ